VGETWDGKNVQVPTGTLILISVSTLALPLAGITISLALYRSCPAANALPFVGAVALSLNSSTCSCVSAEAAAAIEGAIGAGSCSFPIAWVGW
jgi:hypothetical protein